MRDFFLTVLNARTGRKSLATGFGDNPGLFTESEAKWAVDNAPRDYTIKMGMVHVCHVGLEFGLPIVFIVDEAGHVQVINA